MRESLKEALGEPSKIRDIIFVARAVCDTTVGRIKGSKPPDADGNRDPRDLTPVDVFRLEIFRRVCFRRVGAQPDTPGSFGPAVPAVTAATPASITGQPSGRKLKMSAVVDQTLDAEVIALGTDAINKMYEAYRAKYGDVPSPETEPTGDQRAAVHQLVASGATPYIDFAVYGPHGLRLLRKLTFQSIALNSMGEWQRGRDLQMCPDDLSPPGDAHRGWTPMRNTSGSCQLASGGYAGTWCTQLMCTCDPSNSRGFAGSCTHTHTPRTWVHRCKPVERSSGPGHQGGRILVSRGDHTSDPPVGPGEVHSSSLAGSG